MCDGDDESRYCLHSQPAGKLSHFPGEKKQGRAEKIPVNRGRVPLAGMDYPRLQRIQTQQPSDRDSNPNDANEKKRPTETEDDR